MASAPDTLSSNRLRSEPRFLRLAATTNDVTLVGGKGLGLSRLIRAGLPIPPSFCVTSAAFHDVLSSVVREASDLDQLEKLILDATLPKSLISAIDEVLSKNGGGRWAVRSSAISEDGASMSMAGQQVTKLDVEGLEGVLRAIKEVWVSLFSIDALLYRAEFDATHAVPAGIAVILQPMLEPVSAGVLFTTDAMGSSDEAVCTATEGLGVGVVDGSVEATTYYIERPSGYLRRRSGSESPLSPPQLAQLAQLAGRLETLFRQPQDVEWAYVAGDPLPRLMLLQMRPITARSEEPGQESAPVTVWTNANVGEALPGVGSPMTWSIIHRFSTSGFEQAFGSLGLEVPEDHKLVGSFRGRVYLNLTEFMSIASGIPILSPEVLFSVAGGGGVELVRDIYERRSAREFLINLPITIPRIIASQLTMPAVASWWEEHFKRHCEGFFLRDLERLNHSQLASALADVDRLFERNGLIMLASSSNFLMCYVVMREALRLAGGRQAVAHERLMVSGLDTRSAEPGLRLLELGRLARRSLRLRKLISTSPPSETLALLQKHRDKADVAEFLDELEEFRANYGHRAPREAELTTPRWREDPTFIFEVVRGFVLSPHLPSIREAEREKAARIAQVEEVIEKTFGAITRPLFKVLLSYTRGNARRREALRALVVDSLDMYRRYFLECGRRLVTAGVLQQQEDIFFLREEEVRAWLEDPGVTDSFALTVLVRRAIYDAQRQQPDPPCTFLLEGRKMVSEDELTSPAHDRAGIPENAEAIFGLPGSSGRATGRARVLFDPGARITLEHGEVLVVPYADVGWTPLFLTASAVVISLGGPLSHACVVAREFGIPTVVNARDAVHTIKDGDIVTVDGDAGVVFIEP